MRPSLRHLATPSSVGRSSLLSHPVPPVALLPPLHLYRRCLRAHRRKLSPEARILGDEYIKSEFRLHRNADNPVHIVGFLTEWQLYAQALEGDTWRDEKLDKSKLEKMSNEQLAQLYELMMAVKSRALEGEEGEGGKS